MKVLEMVDNKISLKNTEIGLMPEDWTIVEANKLGNIVTGTTPKTSVQEYYGGAYMFIAPGDINDNKYVKRTQKYLSKKGLEVSRSLPRSTVLIVCIGATIGKVAMTAADISTTNQQINALIPNEKVNTDYLYYALKYRSPYLPALAGRAAIPIVNKSNFGKFLVPLPPLPEQKAIAHTLRTIQKAKETRQRELELERERKAALMQYLFTNGTRNEPRKQTEIGEIPESWLTVTLDKVCEFFQYGTSKLCDSDTSGIPVLRIPNVIGGAIDTSDLKFTNPDKKEFEKLSLEVGDLVFVRTNGRKEYLGRCAVFSGKPYNAMFASYLIRIRLKPNTLLPEFVQFYTMTPRGKSYLSGRASNAADGKFNINTQTIKSVLMPVPPLEEQQKIIVTLQACDRKISALEKEITLTNELFQALLEQLMTGQISSQPLINKEN